MRLPEGLPVLAGRVGAALRLAYLAFAALTLAMLAVGGWMSAQDFFVTTPNNLAFGFVTGTGSATAPGVRQVRVYTATSEPARRSGLRRDDIILSVDGTPVPRTAAEHDIGRLTGAVRGDVATIITRSMDGTVRTHRLPRQAGASSARIDGTGLNGWQRSALLFGTDELRLLLFVAAAILLYRRRRNDAVALIFGTAFLMLCHVSGAGMWFWYWVGLDNARHVASMILYAALMVALNVFPDGRFASRWTSALTLFAVPGVFALWVAGWKWRLVSGTTLSAISGALLLATIAGLVIRYRRLPPGLERQQIKWAVFGFAGAILLSLGMLVVRMLGLFFVPNQGAAQFIAAVVVSTLCWLLLPLGLLVSLLRYRLYDADSAISRGASYSFLTVLLVAGFTLAKQAIEMVGERYFEGSGGALWGGLAAAAAALMIGSLHGRVLRWVERRFQRALNTMRSGVPELAGDLRETAGLAELGSAVAERVRAGVRAARVALVLDGRTLAACGEGPEPAHLPAAAEAAKPLAVEPSDPVFPVRLRLDQEEAAPAWLLLGPRPDGSLYGKEERRALEEIAGPVARALLVVRRREAAAAAQARIVEGLSGEMVSLKKRLAGVERRLRAALAPPGAVAAE